MRALHAYAMSDPSTLVVEEAADPVLRPGDALVRVHASGVTADELDWGGTWIGLDGEPRTAPIIPGHEVSGVVEAITPGAEQLAVGQAVFGYIDSHRDGADAELVAVQAGELAPKPAAISHAEAAAMPLSVLTAWQALFDQGGLVANQRVLVHGGAGGVGSFAVQLARWRGAHVIATCSERDIEFVRELGADEVIDYRRERFESLVSDLDLVFDTVGGETWERSWSVLRRGGRLVSIAVPRPPERGTVEGRTSIWFILRPDRDQLTTIAGLVEEGKVRPIVSEIVQLDRAPSVYGRSIPRNGPGKTVLDVIGADADPSRAQPIGYRRTVTAG